MKEIKTFVFDLGGVLFEDGSSHIAGILEEIRGYKKDAINTIIGSELRKQAKKGQVDDAVFWEWVGKQLPQYDTEYIRRAYYDSYVLDEKVMGFVKEARKKGKRCVIFSGNMRSRVEYLENKYHFSKFFDDAIYSYEVGYDKPEAGFFAALLETLKCNPDEALLIDNTEKVLKMAREEFGMQTVLYRTGHTEDLETIMSC